MWQIEVWKSFVAQECEYCRVQGTLDARTGEDVTFSLCRLRGDSCCPLWSKSEPSVSVHVGDTRCGVWIWRWRWRLGWQGVPYYLRGNAGRLLQWPPGTLPLLSLVLQTVALFLLGAPAPSFSPARDCGAPMKMMICDNQSQQLVFWLTGLFCFLSPRQNVTNKSLPAFAY